MQVEATSQPERRQTQKLLIRGGLAAAVLALLYFLVCARDPQAAQGGPGGFGGMAGGMGGFGPAVVETAPVRRGPFEIWGEWVGTLEARSQADLYAKTPGQIVQVLVDTGDRVGQGQVLARIDAAEQREQIDQLAAAVEMARATLAQRRAAQEIARGNASRTQSLYEQQLVALQQQEAAQAELKGAEAQVQVARAAVEQAQANLSAGRVELEQTLIRAPFSGSVGKRHLDLGAFAAGNQPVFTLIDVSTIETTLPLSEKDAARVRVGQPAVVTVEALRGAEFQGRVARIASLFDPRTNTAEAEVEIANSDGRLKPGMFASVAVALSTAPDALLVPRSALVEEERATYVFTVERAAPRPEGAGGGAGREGGQRGGRNGGDGGGAPGGPGAGGPSWTAKRVQVEVLGTGGGGGRPLAAVEGTLRKGQPVITLGQQELRDGSPVVLAAPGAPRPPGGAAQPAAPAAPRAPQ
ncbi:MAG TPA: efflux RND transporter periplasmic adaptor subunit [Thermoanaerobaculia bacterium]|nr:efflux RND transporter periplasmic adaptor subunit [Thermoanaerobaculia bacterium]